jgi:hypothetical protein
MTKGSAALTSTAVTEDWTAGPMGLTLLSTLSELVCSGEKSTPTLKKTYDGKASWPILLSSTGGLG